MYEQSATSMATAPGMYTGTDIRVLARPTNRVHTGPGIMSPARYNEARPGIMRPDYVITRTKPDLRLISGLGLISELGLISD